MLNVMADSLEARKGEFATLETLDCGKPIAESEADIDFCVDILRYVTTLPPPLLPIIFVFGLTVTFLSDNTAILH